MGDEKHKAGEPGEGEQAEKAATDEHVADIEEAQDDLTVPDTQPVIVGDARDGQPVVGNDPHSTDPATVEIVDDPNKVISGDGTETPLDAD